MPVKLDDGCIYTDVKGSDGKIARIKLFDLVTTSTNKRGGRKALHLTDDGEMWIEQEIAKGANIDDLAAEMCVDVTTLYTPANRLKTKRAVEKGEGMVNNRLRRAQFKAALNGNATMLVWLGKNRLGQSDSPRGMGNEALADFADAIVKASRSSKHDTEGWEERCRRPQS